MFLDLLIFDNIWTSTDLDMNLDAILNFGLLIAWNLEQNGICRESKMRTQKKKKKMESGRNSRREFFLESPTGQ